MTSRLGFTAGLTAILFVLGLVMGESFLADRLGHDYTYFVPMLLSGQYWWLANGVFAVPWFTPAMCGGLPFLANPQNMYYSVPQLLTLLTDPANAVYVTILLFGALGFVGMYRLLVRQLTIPVDVAVFAASAFVLNGFWLQRMLTGHFTNHGFMLVPLITLCLLPSNRPGPALAMLRWITAAGLIAYLVHSGAANLMVPAMLAVLGCGLIVSSRRPVLPGFLLRMATAGALAAALSASKITAALALMAHFPRDQYSLPGFNGPLAAAKNLLLALAGWDPQARAAALVNSSFPLPAMEMDYGITPLPWLLALIGLGFAARRYRHLPAVESGTRATTMQYLSAVGVVFILVVPLALNTWAPGWTEWLRSLPYLRSSSSLLRWIALDIPLLLVLMALAASYISPILPRQILMISATVALLGYVTTTQRYQVLDPTFDPSTVRAGWLAARVAGAPPSIERIVVADAQTYIGTSDVMVAGSSELICYEPVFGYSLENYPIGDLHPGPVLEEQGGRLNLKNPACYPFAAANACAPGDHFTVAQRQDALAFIRYQPFPFEQPLRQQVAGWINMTAVIAWLLLLFGTLLRLFLRRLF